MPKKTLTDAFEKAEAGARDRYKKKYPQDFDKKGNFTGFKQ